MNNNIKLLALDMDGTTYDLHGDMIKENIKPILDVQKKGIHVVFITGRPLYNVLPEAIKFYSKENSGYVIAYNGACIFNIKKNKILENDFMSKKNIKNIFEICNKNNIDIWCYTDNPKKIVTNFDPTGFEESYFLTDDIEVEIRSKNANFEINAYKLIIAKNGSKEGHKLIEKFCKEQHLNVAGGINDVYEVNSSKINKGIAIKKLLKFLKIDLNNTMAIGDGENDVSMLKIVGTSIAMANANANVKLSAKEITESNINGGVAKAIYKHILNEKD